MTSNLEYNEEESQRTELAYQSPEIVHQRARTLAFLDPRPGETVVDVGCGPGLLAVDIAAAVGAAGQVTGIDSSAAMIALAERRCAGLANVQLLDCDATALSVADASADAVVCTQVLLYVDDVEQALAEFLRILRPGGRVVVMETDWRSAVLHSGDEAMAERIIACWDRAVPSARLPARLGPLLRAAGFGDVRIDAIPVISTSADQDGYAMTMMEQCAQAAHEQDVISDDEGRAWLRSLARLGEAEAFFFCVNRFLFGATRGERA